MTSIIEKAKKSLVKQEKKNDIDQNLFKEINDNANQLRSDNAKKEALFKKYKRAYLLSWDESDRRSLKHTKITLSTDPRNKVLGAVRLMVATDPEFNVEYTSNEGSKDRIEKALNYMWDRAGRIANMPIHYDALLSAILYGEMHIVIIDTEDLLKAANASKKGVARAERICAITPYLYEVWSAEGGRFMRDVMGPCAYHRESKVSVGQLRTDFGDDLPEKTKQRKSHEIMILNTWFDTENTCHWLDKDGVIDLAPHGLPAMPVCVQIVDGSNIFENPEEQTQPLLYGVIQSGLWNRQNLAMTVMYTLIHGMGISPIWLHRSPTGEKLPIELNFDKLGGVVDMIAGEELSPLRDKAVIDPSMREGFNLATEKIEESTIREQALGGQLTGNTTFSALALLSQSGRLPLIGPQKRGGWGIANVAETTLSFMKHKGKVFNYGGIELKTADIPDDIQIEVKLEVNLPQDKLQLANVANMLTEGDDPIAPRSWVRENILNMGQSDSVEEEIWTEKAATMHFMLYQEEQIRKAKQGAAIIEGENTTVPVEGQGQVPLPSSTENLPGSSAGPVAAGEIPVEGISQNMRGVIPGAGEAAALPPEGV